jgi:hypothetical protein
LRYLIAAISTCIIGQDFSIGYLSHTETRVRLYLQETFTLSAINQRSHRRPLQRVPLVWTVERRSRRQVRALEDRDL